MKYTHLFFSLSVLLFFSGCAHKITVTPELEKIRSAEVSKQFDINVGYYISPADRAFEITTPGGGGDDVKYTPYKDTEGAFNTVLSKVFTRVYSLPALDDQEFIAAKNIKYVFTQSIKTTSSSDSLLTWPPTQFTMAITCQAIDTNGKKIWEETVSSEGNAEFEEFRDDFSLAGKRASEDAYLKLMYKLMRSDKFQ
ncbi:hypothetical protein WCX49_00740 [Sulfurimonas sp. HSL-1656]|uniref:hypothetical protein n=1 Tax=Thiomicrolovo subterrani TaxID=3131934 RepID=UPI0031F8D9D9